MIDNGFFEPMGKANQKRIRDKRSQMVVEDVQITVLYAERVAKMRDETRREASNTEA